MQTTNNPINGLEDTTVLNNADLKILYDFYKAFNQRDLELMQKVWLNTGEASMDNPIGGIRRGWDEIKQGYNKIFNGKAKVFVEFYDYSVHLTDNMFFVTGRERGYFKSDGEQIDLAIRTSRIFIKHEGCWKHIHHHGSIEDPALLKIYQQAVLHQNV
ncbi:MAG: YybH family protein [Sphingobacteriales bacterium]